MKKDALTEGLDRFFNQFSSTRDLVHELIRSKSHPQEILILLCSRIDALASGSTSEDESSGNAFSSFVTMYSGRSKLFESISVGDLYYELDYHLWLLPGMLEKTGRIQIFSQVNEPILKLLVDSQIALTLEQARRLLKRIQLALRRAFRVAPGQSRKKHPLASAAAIERAVLDEFGKRGEAEKFEMRKAFNPPLKTKTVGRILYHKFRCGVIHGGKVRINEAKFFTEREPYWRPLHSEYYGPFHLVEFPANFLAALFAECMRNYRKKLEATRRVPPDIHFEMFPDNPFSHLELLDQTLLPRRRTAVPK
jgi:hypothetical protein